MTTDCKACEALVWTHEVPNKKSGYCWRCEIKRLNGRIAYLESKLEKEKKNA